MVRQLAPDDTTWLLAQEVATKGGLQQPGVSSDGTWLLADGLGSARTPYCVSVDFIDQMPRLPTGKLYKRGLRDAYWAGRSTRIA